MKFEEYKAHLIALLKSLPKVLDNEGELLTDQVKRLARNYDNELLEVLYKDDKSRAKFFRPIGDTTVFLMEDFIFFIDERQLDNTYTSYENRIGLSTGKYMLEDVTDIVLNFPYKDCILEGGQSSEEGEDIYFEYDEKKKQYIEKKSKRKEIFFNQILAQSEIDRLKEPKAFTHIKKYSEKGVESLNSFTRDNKGTIKDNLIIKGNNLLALYSLLEEFRGKVKLIYIDPPYNTGNDSFTYNDNFSRSTWLTFMSNRLVLAKQLLKDDGVIFIQCDDNEQAYLRVLLDQKYLFGENNFVNTIIPEMSNMSGPKIEHAIQGRRFPKIKEYIHMYAKNKNRLRLKIPKEIKKEWDKEYNLIIPDFTRDEFDLLSKAFKDNNIKQAEEVISKHKLLSLSSFLKGNKIKASDEWLYENSYRILASKPNKAIREKALAMKFKNDMGVVINSRGDMKLIKTDFNRHTQTARIELTFALNNQSIFIGDIWHNIATTGGVAQEGGVVLKNGKKPEVLLKRVIECSTEENDIVLDFHLGSGTTSAVAQKMKRQYIGVEQIENQVDLSIARLKNVIAGDQTGVSKELSWQGGGSFVYMELAKNNQKAIDCILQTKNLEELIEYFGTMCNKYFLDYNVKVKDFMDEIYCEEEFQKLSLDKQKQIFIKMLDLNQLYVNYSDMEDEAFGLSEEDIRLTQNFYNKTRE